MNPLEKFRTDRKRPISYEELGRMLGGAKKHSVWEWCNDVCLPSAKYRAALADATGGRVTYLKMVKYSEDLRTMPKRKAA